MGIVIQNMLEDARHKAPKPIRLLDAPRPARAIYGFATKRLSGLIAVGMPAMSTTPHLRIMDEFLLTAAAPIS